MEPQTYEEESLWLHSSRSSDVCLCGGITGSRKPMIEEVTVVCNKPTKHNCSLQREKSLCGIHKVISDMSPLIIQVEKQFLLDGLR